MLDFSIMPLDEKHIDEQCRDIEYQVRSGIATMPLFSFTLTPEGNPTIDKAGLLCRIYEKYKAKLDSMGVPSGVLIQASIGHGWKLNQPFAFQKYTSLTNGETYDTCCPLDKGFQDYIRKAAATIAASKPHHIMLDDDFRLIGRVARGCTCPLHIARLSDELGYEITREQAASALLEKTGEDAERIRELFIKTQVDSLIECAHQIRGGIDSVDPNIPGSFCLCGNAAEGAYEIASIMAGRSNPVVIRVNNANYCAKDPREFAKIMHRAATQIAALSGRPDIILAETDTCPQNRYSTPAAKLHSHYTFSILEGARGAKHWITRLRTYEPASGKAYRKKLETYNGFYNELARIADGLSWQGCRIPVADKPYYTISPCDAAISDVDGWCSHVLDRFGLPMYFGKSGEGTCFFDGMRDVFFTDEQILEFLSGNIVLDAVAAERFIARGFLKYLGVDVKKRAADAKNASGEIIYNTGISNAQFEVRELVPISDRVKSCSDVYHLRDGKYYDVMFPGVTAYRNELGGNVVVFSGNTNFSLGLTSAFGFLNESRKAQLVQILKDMGSLPVYYPEDAEVLLKAAATSDGKLFCALLDMSLDAIDDLPLVTDRQIKNVKRLTADGSYRDVGFEKDGDTYRLELTAYPFDPVILIIE